jgi:hypothetical protein
MAPISASPALTTWERLPSAPAGDPGPVPEERGIGTGCKPAAEEPGVRYEGAKPSLGSTIAVRPLWG